MGNLLTEAREEAGLTQAKAAERIGITPRALQGWEAGSVIPYRRNLLKAGKAYGKTVEELGGQPLEEYLEDQIDRIEEKVDEMLSILKETATEAAPADDAEDIPDYLRHAQDQPPAAQDEDAQQTPKAKRRRRAG